MYHNNAVYKRPVNIIWYCYYRWCPDERTTSFSEFDSASSRRRRTTAAPRRRCLPTDRDRSSPRQIVDGPSPVERWEPRCRPRSSRRRHVVARSQRGSRCGRCRRGRTAGRGWDDAGRRSSWSRTSGRWKEVSASRGRRHRMSDGSQNSVSSTMTGTYCPRRRPTSMFYRNHTTCHQLQTTTQFLRDSGCHESFQQVSKCQLDSSLSLLGGSWFSETPWSRAYVAD